MRAGGGSQLHPLGASAGSGASEGRVLRRGPSARGAADRFIPLDVAKQVGSQALASPFEDPPLAEPATAGSQARPFKTLNPQDPEHNPLSHAHPKGKPELTLLVADTFVVSPTPNSLDTHVPVSPRYCCLPDRPAYISKQCTNRRDLFYHELPSHGMR